VSETPADVETAEALSVAYLRMVLDDQSVESADELDWSLIHTRDRKWVHLAIEFDRRARTLGHTSPTTS
jgi:hypothetical protein